MKSKVNIIGITDGSYPYGGATTVRNLALFKGLKENNYNVLLLSIYPDKNQDIKSSNLSGVFEGVPFRYTCKHLKYQKNTIVHLAFICLSLFKTIFLTFKNYKTSNTVIINFIPNPILSFIITYLLTKRKYIVLHEVTEFPFLRNFNHSITKFFYYKLTLPRFHKIFVITNALKEFFAQYTDSNKIEILNMIVDPSRFRTIHKPIFNFEYIAYCGMMNTDKDGVPILIDAYAEVIKKHPKIKLVLIGDIKNRPIHVSIKNAIEKNKLHDKIIFTGQISNSDIPLYLQNAKILALARPDNIQAKGGFPTKLGEYLATGKPVVVTRVGEIPRFLQDGKNAFFSNPNASDFSKKIITVLNSFNLAEQVGKEGLKLIENEFNYLKESIKIKEVITQLINDI